MKLSKLGVFPLMGLLLAVLIGSISFAKMEKGMTHSGTPGHTILTVDQLKWMGAPSALPSGAQIAILEGNPMKSGPYTMRILAPANYRVPPHWHSELEHVTVVSGTFYLGLGDKFDTTKGKELTTGSFAVMHPKVKHYAWTTEETVIQLHGIGPWNIHYINPADDPRNMKKTY